MIEDLTHKQQPKPIEDGDDVHAQSVEDVSNALLRNPKLGLSNGSAAELLEQYGRNELKYPAGVNPWKILLRHAVIGLTAVLVIAMTMSFARQEITPERGCTLVIVIAFNTIDGFAQEYCAEKNMDALRKMASPSAKVIRDGRQLQIPCEEMVSRDLLTFEVEDIVTANCRLIEVLNLEIDKALRTEEAGPSMKAVELIKGKDVSIRDRTNMVYSRNTVVKGRREAIVVSTGMSTEIGKISKAISKSKTQSTTV